MSAWAGTQSEFIYPAKRSRLPLPHIGAALLKGISREHLEEVSLRSELIYSPGPQDELVQWLKRKVKEHLQRIIRPITKIANKQKMISVLTGWNAARLVLSHVKNEETTKQKLAGRINSDMLMM